MQSGTASRRQGGPTLQPGFPRSVRKSPGTAAGDGDLGHLEGMTALGQGDIKSLSASIATRLADNRFYELTGVVDKEVSDAKLTKPASIGKEGTRSLAYYRMPKIRGSTRLLRTSLHFRANEVLIF
jgi:hypothetical protein